MGAVPAAAALEASQDRLVEKQLFRRLGIPTARIDDEVEAFPALLKTRRLGYDGKGQRLVADPAAGTVPGHVLEERVSFDRELSLLAVRGAGGDTRFWPLVENVHEDGILRSSRAPAAGRAAGGGRGVRPPAPRRARLRRRPRARALRRRRQPARERVRAARAQHGPLDDRGRGDEPVRESPARDPRPAARARPTSATSLLMRNLIGTMPSAEAVLGVPGAHLHLYGKEPRPGRKLGHVTLVEPTPSASGTRASARERGSAAATADALGILRVTDPRSGFALARKSVLTAAAVDLAAAGGADAPRPLRLEHPSSSRPDNIIVQPIAIVRAAEGHELRVNRHRGTSLSSSYAVAHGDALGSTTRDVSDRIRGCRARSSTDRRGRASPGRCAGRRRPRAGASRRSAGAGGGGRASAPAPPSRRAGAGSGRRRRASAARRGR